MELPRGCADRAVYGITISIIMILSLGGLIGVFFEWHPDSVGGTVGKVTALEVLVLLNVMLGLTLLWCLFTPAWVERALERRERWFKTVLTLVILAGVVTLVVLSARGF